MSKIIRCFLTALLLCIAVQSGAQSYDDLWKQVDNYRKKDLPTSVQKSVLAVYEKAQQEKIEAQDQQIKELQSKLSAVDSQDSVAENEELKNRVDLMKEAIIELGAKYKFKGSQILNFIDSKVQENKK